MDRDTAISLAQKAGILPEWIPIVPALPDFLERFAALCEAHGYEKGVAALHEAVKMEREACAIVAEGSEQTRDWFPTSLWANLRNEIAARIRMRSSVEDKQLEKKSTNLDSLRRDAQRYRFLREMDRLEAFVAIEQLDYASNDEFDASVDTAMARQPPKGD